MSDQLYDKTEALLKGLLSVKSDSMRTASPVGQTIKAPKLPSKLPDVRPPKIKGPSIPKISSTPPKPKGLPTSPEKAAEAVKVPGGLPPPSKKDPAKMAAQLTRPDQTKLVADAGKEEVIKTDKNGQWSLELEKGSNRSIPKDKAARSFHSRWDQPHEANCEQCGGEPHIATSVPSRVPGGVEHKGTPHPVQLKGRPWDAENDDFEKQDLDPAHGITFQHVHHDLGGDGDLTHVRAVHPTHGTVGEAMYQHQPDGTLQFTDVTTHPEWRRMGIASGMTQHAMGVTGKPIGSHTPTTDAGAAFKQGAIAQHPVAAKQLGKSEPHKDLIPGGLADNKKPFQFPKNKLKAGTKVEKEHTSISAIAEEIAMDHLTEDPEYYKKLKTIEKK